MKRLFILTALICTSALVSCSTTSQVSLDYTSGPGHVKPGSPEFSARLFTDQRSQGSMELGTVRTQIGTPVEYVQTRVPVSEVVTNAFGYGLQARGMLTRPRVSRYIVTGEVLDLYCQMLVRPYGYARIRVTVLEAASGQIVHSRVYTGERGSKAYIPGSGSPVPLLRDLVSGALQDVVDKALDDQTLRNRLGSREVPAPYDMTPPPPPSSEPAPYGRPDPDYISI